VLITNSNDNKETNNTTTNNSIRLYDNQPLLHSHTINEVTKEGDSKNMTIAPITEIPIHTTKSKEENTLRTSKLDTNNVSGSRGFANCEIRSYYLRK
jgi:hypothetical protein